MRFLPYYIEVFEQEIKTFEKSNESQYGFIRRSILIYYLPHQTSEFCRSNNNAAHNKIEAFTYNVEAHFHAFLSTQREDGISAMILECLVFLEFVSVLYNSISSKLPGFRNAQI